MELDVLLQALGRCHPLVVHFPIALLLVAGALELFRPGERGPSEAAFVCLLVGSAGALASAALGWLAAEHDPPGRALEDLVFRHRWVGVATCVVSVLSAGLAVAARSGRTPQRGAHRARGLCRIGVLVSAALVAYGGALGGSISRGEGYFTDVLEKLWGSADAPAAGAADEPDPAVEDYVTRIRPIFQARCYECHGTGPRVRGGLKLNDMADVFAGEPADWVIRPGDAAGSLLYQRITLPPGHDDIMPAKGEPLSAEEIAAIGEWIDRGAAWTDVGATAAPSGDPAAAGDVGVPADR